jgi:hypothetical protein
MSNVKCQIAACSGRLRFLRACAVLKPACVVVLRRRTSSELRSHVADTLFVCRLSRMFECAVCVCCRFAGHLYVCVCVCHATCLPGRIVVGLAFVTTRVCRSCGWDVCFCQQASDFTNELNFPAKQTHHFAHRSSFLSNQANLHVPVHVQYPHAPHVHATSTSRALDKQTSQTPSQ